MWPFDIEKKRRKRFEEAMDNLEERIKKSGLTEYSIQGVNHNRFDRDELYSSSQNKHSMHTLVIFLRMFLSETDFSNVKSDYTDITCPFCIGDLRIGYKPNPNYSDEYSKYLCCNQELTSQLKLKKSLLNNLFNEMSSSEYVKKINGIVSDINKIEEDVSKGFYKIRLMVSRHDHYTYKYEKVSRHDYYKYKYDDKDLKPSVYDIFSFNYEKDIFSSYNNKRDHYSVFVNSEYEDLYNSLFYNKSFFDEKFVYEGNGRFRWTHQQFMYSEPEQNYDNCYNYVYETVEDIKILSPEEKEFYDACSIIKPYFDKIIDLDKSLWVEYKERYDSLIGAINNINLQSSRIKHPEAKLMIRIKDLF